MEHRLSKFAVLALSAMIGCDGDAGAGGGMGGTAGVGGTGGAAGMAGAGGSAGSGGSAGTGGAAGAGGAAGTGGMGGTGGTVPSTGLYIELVWSTPGDPDETDTGPGAGSDLDLHFAHPFADSGSDVDGDGSNDPWFDQTFDVFWFNANPNWGSLDPIINDDPAMTAEDTDGAGPEAIALEIGENVTYRIGVHYWNDHGFGTSAATVRVFFDGVLEFTSDTVTLSQRDLWEVAEVLWPTQSVTAITAMGGGHKIAPGYSHPFLPAP